MAGAPGTLEASVPPNQTLYVRNLNDKLGKEVLKRNLYNLFSSFGRVLDIVALKTMKMRGQAHVVFEDIPGASAALRGLQNFPFFDRPLKISYAKSRSNAVAVHQGTYRKRTRREEDGSEGSGGSLSGRHRRSDAHHCADMETEDVEERPAGVAGAASAPLPEPPNKPNRILFVSNLPAEITDEMLSLLFQQYPGFKEVRLVPGKTDIAFVEFETEVNATTARDVLDGFKLTPRDRMNVTFAKVGT
ncbi:hypothetical protein DFJ74DRAFT_611284 [Hyaloraphidium curvatum]|nr:hypothetical protein DFJ74DRAFT_611284 [Hyaloraphidium curvatum]